MYKPVNTHNERVICITRSFSLFCARTDFNIPGRVPKKQNMLCKNTRPQWLFNHIEMNTQHNFLWQDQSDEMFNLRDKTLEYKEVYWGPGNDSIFGEHVPGYVNELKRMGTLERTGTITIWRTLMNGPRTNKRKLRLACYTRTYKLACTLRVLY